MPNPNLLRLLTVTVGDADAWERVDDSLVQIWRLKLGHNVKFETLSARFGQDFETEAQARF